MLTLSQIRREHRLAGSVNRLLAPWGFVNEDTFITKAGHVGLVYRIGGVDFEGLDDERRRRYVHHYEAALRLLDPSFRVYQYLCKRRTPPMAAGTADQPRAQQALDDRVEFLNGKRLYDIDLYLVLLYEGLTPSQAGWRGWFQPAGTALLEADLAAALAHLHHAARTVEFHLDDLRPVLLGKADAFAFFRRLVNYSAPDVRLKYDTHVDYFMADETVECRGNRLVVGRTPVKALTMKDAPAQTFPGMQASLYELPGEFIACLEWRRIPVEKMRREVNSRRRHFHNKRVSMVNYVSSDTKPEEMLVDASASAVVGQLNDALTDMEVHGHFFGECSLTLVMYGEEVDRLAAKAGKVLAAHDGSFIDESYNLLNAWVSIVPGNSAHNVRRLALLETHAADLGFLFSVDQGEVEDAAGRRALAVFETTHHTPYRFHLHVQDVGHTLVLGATGSGKSFLLNALMTHAQQYRPQTVIFDLGHSYRKLAEWMGGSYLEFGLDTGVTINPFAMAPTPEHLHFLHAFVKVLLDGSDGYTLSDADERELYEAVENVYVLDAGVRRLRTVAQMLPAHLTRRLGKWIEDGRFAKLFDHLTDTMSVHAFQVFEFEAIREFPDLLEPLLFYILHRVHEAVLTSSNLTICVMDEAWRFIQHPTLRDYVQTAMKTWRKKNAAMILATQAVEDFASADLLRTVVENCPTKLLLANADLDRDVYAKIFGLNPVELDLLRNLRAKGQVLLKRDALTKVLNLNVDERSRWLFTTAPCDRRVEVNQF